MLKREAVYLWYYFTLQFEQIFNYWILGMAIGSFISVFCKEKIHSLFSYIKDKRLGLLGIIPACILGIASPLCMYGTIPVAASFYKQGMREDWLAAFMTASILLNPQLIIYSAALGKTALTVRIASCFCCGICAGLLIYIYYNKYKKSFFNFTGFDESIANRDTHPNLLIRYLKNFYRNVKATGLWFVLGIFLTALFMRYVPAESFAKLFGRKSGFGVLMAATVGVPLYACGGGTIPLLQQWLADGMSMASAAAFMITGPATKITNLGALKIILGVKHFIIYLLFIMLYALANAFIVNLLV